VIARSAVLATRGALALAVHLRRNDATDRQEFLRAFSDSYVTRWGSRAKGENLHTVANISDWLVTKLAPMDQTSSRDGIAKFRQFLFSKRDGCTVMQVRARCADEHILWRGLDETTEFHKVRASRGEQVSKTQFRCGEKCRDRRSWPRCRPLKSQSTR
jgi:hypothetical protein